MKKEILVPVIGYTIFEVVMYLVTALCELQLNPINWSHDNRLGFSVWTIFMLFVAAIIYGVMNHGKSNKNKKND